ncbi:unnamed protein product [Rhizopus stolonifer]
MDTSEFFESQDDLSFENYLKKTHQNWSRDSLASVRTILQRYINDVKNQQRQGNSATTHLKISYKDVEMRELIQRNPKNSNNSDQSTIYNNYISSRNIEELNIEQKRSREQTPEQASTSKPEQSSTSTRGKRNCRHIAIENFVSSEVITDNDTNSDITSSPSSFFPSDLMNVPVGYTCRIEMNELEDVFYIPLPIPNSHFAALVAAANKKSEENQLFPTDCLARLHASAIFKTDGPFLMGNDDDDDNAVLPKNVYKNILTFKRAVQKHTLYIQSHPCTTLEQVALNNIITSTYLLHGKPKIKSKGSELNFVASSVSIFLNPLFSAHDQIQVEFDTTSWIFKQNNIDNVRLRPDIIFNYQQQEEVVEVGCGEVKKPGVSQALLDEDKIRVLEVMKRQLHLRLYHAKKEYEAATFGVLVQGATVILLEMKMDLENGVYMYHEQQPFTLPTTHHTHAHMEIALEVITKFKNKMLNSLLRAEDHNCQNIWSLYKPHVRPTVSYFDPIYHS